MALVAVVRGDYAGHAASSFLSVSRALPIASTSSGARQAGRQYLRVAQRLWRRASEAHHPSTRADMSAP